MGEKILKSLRYSLKFDLKQDKFIFARTCRWITTVLSNSKIEIKYLSEIEDLLISHGVSEKSIEEIKMELELEKCFGDQGDWWSKKRHNQYISNVECGLLLLELVRDKKKAPR